MEKDVLRIAHLLSPQQKREIAAGVGEITKNVLAVIERLK